MMITCVYIYIYIIHILCLSLLYTTNIISNDNNNTQIELEIKKYLKANLPIRIKKLVTKKNKKNLKYFINFMN